MLRRLAGLLLVLAIVGGLAACGGGGTGGVADLPGSPSSPPSDPPPTDPPADPPPDDPPPSSTSMSAAELGLALEVLDLVNLERQAAGLTPLAFHEGAAEVAYQHSLDMDVRDYFDHTNPDGDLPWDRLTAAGIAWSTVGENIAWGYPTPQAVMTGWMNSDGHRANILRPGFTHIGVGVHDDGSSIWWTQVFLVPR